MSFLFIEYLRTNYFNSMQMDLFNKIKDEVFITEKIYSDYNTIYEGIPADLFLTKKEKLQQRKP